MFRSARPLVVLGALALLPLPLAADTAQTALVWGRVVSASRTPMSGARVYLRDTTTGLLLASAPTQRGGDYSIRDVPSGTYEAFVEITLGAFLGRQTIETRATSSVVVDLTAGPPAIGEALPRADRFPSVISARPGGYAAVSVGDSGGGMSTKARTGIIVGAVAGGVAVLALVINAIDDGNDEPAASEVVP